MALVIRRVPDKSDGERVVRFDPETGARKLVNPATPGDDHEPWPLAGVIFEQDPPDKMNLPAKTVARGVAEGWIERVNSRPVLRPAGPNMETYESSQTGTPHTFFHCDEIVLKPMDGQAVRYRVVHQPDKYAVVGRELVSEDKGLVRDVIDPEAKVTPEIYASGLTRVDNYYGLERIDG